MQFLKYSLLFSILLKPVFAQESFSFDECLNLNFDITVKHNVLPFGLLPKSIQISKLPVL